MNNISMKNATHYKDFAQSVETIQQSFLVDEHRLMVQGAILTIEAYVHRASRKGFCHTIVYIPWEVREKVIIHLQMLGYVVSENSIPNNPNKYHIAWGV